MKLKLQALPFLVALAIAGAAQAQETAPAKDVVVGRFSVASVDAITKLIADLGIPDTGFFNIAENFEDAPFLGKGTLAKDKPLGIVLVAGPKHRLVPLPDSLVFAFPAVPGRATETDLKVAGATTIEGSPGMYSMEGAVVRRSTDYLFAKPTGTFGLDVLTDAVFSSDYKDATNLMALSANLDLLRKAAPDTYVELAKNILELPKVMGIPGITDETKPVTSVLDAIDKFTLALGQDDNSLHLKSWTAPSPVTAKAKEAPRPAFPAGMIMQMHLVYPTPEAAAFLEKQLTALPENLFGGDLPPVYHQRAKALVLRAANLNTNTSAVSMGFAMKDGHAVFYIVDQFSDVVDAGKELTEIAQAGVGLATESGGDKVKLAVDATTYDAGGKKVQRLTFTAGESKTKLIVDEVQIGKVAYLAISDNADGKYVPDLAAAGMNGNSSMLCAGAIDLGAGLSAAVDSGGMPGLSPDSLQKLKIACAGQAITWTVQASEQNFLFTDITVPKLVLRELIKSQTPTRVEGVQPNPGLR